MTWRRAFQHVLVLQVLAVALPVQAALNDDEARILEWVDTHMEGAFGLLEESVNISSGTMNHAGVRQVGAVMRRELDDLGLETEWIDMPVEVNRAGHLLGRKDGPGKNFLLIGHLDTVFEADDAFQSYASDGVTATGPGVNDMKSGNVIIVYALRALQSVGKLDELGIVVAYTGDEEKAGQPLSISRRDLVDAGQWADISLGFEAAVHYDDTDWATTSRRSSSNWILETSGKQAHSSGVFSDAVGAGAVYEAARILTAFYDELRDEEFLTFNAANIQGGTEVQYDSESNRGGSFGKTNIVPRKAVVSGDIRAISEEQLQRVEARMRAIVDENLPMTSATIEFTGKYPPMSPTAGNQRLADILSEINQDLGRGPMSLLSPLQRGAADISFVAPYSDSLAGLGALGSGGHTPNESLELASMALAIKRAALLMYRLNQQ